MWSPLFSHCFREPRHPGFRKGVVCLPGVARGAARGRNVYDAPRSVIPDSEIGRRGADEAEGGGGVQGEDGGPLLIGHFVEDSVPGEAGIIDNDVDPAIAEICTLADEVVDVACVEHVAGDGKCFSTIIVYGFCDGGGLFCSSHEPMKILCYSK